MKRGKLSAVLLAAAVFAGSFANASVSVYAADKAVKTEEAASSSEDAAEKQKPAGDAEAAAPAKAEPAKEEAPTKEAEPAKETAPAEEAADKAAEKAPEEAAAEYELFVSGVRVTSDNAGDIFGDGTAVYDAETGTLTLNNAVIKTAPVEDYSRLEPVSAGIYWADTAPLLISLSGKNTVSTDKAAAREYGIHSEGEMIFEEKEGGASLLVEVKAKTEVVGIDAIGDVTFRNADVSVIAEAGTRKTVGVKSRNRIEISGHSDVKASASAEQKNGYQYGLLAKNIAVGNAAKLEASASPNAVFALRTFVFNTKRGALVKAEAGGTKEESAVWDGKSPLSTDGKEASFSYVRIPAEDESYDLTVKGGKQGKDYTYEDGTLTFLRNGKYTVSMAEDVKESSHRIVIKTGGRPSGFRLTLNGVSLKSDTDAVLVDTQEETADEKAAGEDKTEAAGDAAAEEGASGLKLIFRGRNTLTAPEHPVNYIGSEFDLTLASAGGTKDSLTLVSEDQGDLICRNFTLESGKVNLNGTALLCLDSVSLNGGEMEIKCEKDAVYADNRFAMTAGKLTVETPAACIHVPGVAGTAKKGVSILGGELTLRSTQNSTGAVSVGTVRKKDIVIGEGKINIEQGVIGILLRNGSDLTVEGGNVTIKNTTLGIWPYTDSADSVITLSGGETEITSSSCAIRLDTADRKSVVFGKGYEHAVYSGETAKTREKIADKNLTGADGISSKYVLVTLVVE